MESNSLSAKKGDSNPVLEDQEPSDQYVSNYMQYLREENKSFIHHQSSADSD